MVLLIIQANEINEIIGIDSTFDTTQNNFSLIVFTGVNKFYCTSVLAMCLVSGESSEYYKFALNYPFFLKILAILNYFLFFKNLCIIN